MSEPTTIRTPSRKSALGVFLLGAFTMGIYNFVWLAAQYKAINSLGTKRTVPGWAVAFVCVWSVYDPIESYLERSHQLPDGVLFNSLNDAFFVAGGVLWLWLVFRARRILIDYVGSRSSHQPGTGPYISIMMTFLFTSAYLQSHINQIFHVRKALESST